MTKNTDTKNRKYLRLGELFCGPGGLAKGLIESVSEDGSLGVIHAWANDFHSDTCETYRKNICPDDPDSVICSDVRDLDIDSLSDIDLFAYGFPCNSFSTVGEHQGISNEKFGELYQYGVEVLKKKQPLAFIAENVSGIRSAGSGDFQRILRELAETGYTLTSHLYKAEEYGVPQTRHRVIIVGIRNDLNRTFEVPSTEPYENADISTQTALEGITDDMPNTEVRKMSAKVAERLTYIRPGENCWMAEERMPEHLHIKTKTRISQIYRKLDPEKPSYTITASGGGGTFGYHWTNRELTNRERARIQTFPDNYEFVGNYMSVRRQIGMAVPVKLASIVGTALLNTLAAK